MAKKRGELSLAERFYAESKRAQGAARIAEDLGVPAALVEAHLSSLKPPPAKTFFIEHKGSVVMTEAQSKRDDDAPRPDDREYYDSVGCVSRT